MGLSKRACFEVLMNVRICVCRHACAHVHMYTRLVSIDVQITSASKHVIVVSRQDMMLLPAIVHAYRGLHLYIGMYVLMEMFTRAFQTVSGTYYASSYCLGRNASTPVLFILAGVYLCRNVCVTLTIPTFTPAHI